MKTSKAYFERFKAEFLRWRDKLGLTQYRIVFYHKLLKTRENTYFAQLDVSEKDKLVSVFLTTNIVDPKNDEGPESHARHEVIHLLIHKLTWLGECRFVSEDELYDEAESVVVRLEKVLE